MTRGDIMLGNAPSGKPESEDMGAASNPGGHVTPFFTMATFDDVSLLSVTHLCVNSVPRLSNFGGT